MSAPAALACFGLVDLAVIATDLPVVAELAVLVAVTAVYLAGVWSRRAPLGLGAFRSALRRTPAARRPSLAGKA